MREARFSSQQGQVSLRPLKKTRASAGFSVTVFPTSTDSPTLKPQGAKAKKQKYNQEKKKLPRESPDVLPAIDRKTNAKNQAANQPDPF